MHIARVGEEEQVASVGVIGLGSMGVPIALALRDAGFTVTATSRSAATREAAAGRGVPVVDGIPEVARAVEEGEPPVVVTSLPAGPQVRDAVLDGMPPGTVVVDTSTCAPSDSRALAAELAERGRGLVDAPVSGGPTAARSGTLAVMAGGSAEHLDAVDPVLRALAGRLVVCGESGAGQIAKACNQLVVVSTIGTVAEALALAAKLGADPVAVREALLGGYASSRILELHGQRMLDGDFRPGGAAHHQVKDIEIVRQLLDDPSALEVFEAAAGTMEQLVADGHGELDHSAAVKVVEQRLGVRLRPD
ncbi:MAG: NAD-binding protein [Pseudonocardiaceae bacterium]|nr:NAD-binding protein [Pseudonocardiaceae bacterium]